MSDRENDYELNNKPRFGMPRRWVILSFILLLLVFLGLSAALLPLDIVIVIMVGVVALVPLSIFLVALFSKRTTHLSNVPYGALDTSSRVAMTPVEHSETAVEAEIPTSSRIRQLDFATKDEAEVADVFESAAPHLETLDLSELTLGKHWPSVFKCPWPRLRALNISHTDINTQGHFWDMTGALGGREEKGELPQKAYATRARLEAWDAQQAARTQFILRKPFPALEALDVAGMHLGKRPVPVFHASYVLVRAMHHELKSPAITYLPLPYPRVPLERSPLPITEFVDFGHLPEEKLTVTCEMPISRTIEGLALVNTAIQKNEVTGQSWRKKKTERLFQWKPDVLKDIRLYYQSVENREGKALPVPEEPSRDVLAELAPPPLPDEAFGFEEHKNKHTKKEPPHLLMAECIDFSVPPVVTHKPKPPTQKVMVLRRASFTKLRKCEWRTAVGEFSTLYFQAKKAERREQQRRPLFPVLRTLDLSSNRLSDGRLLTLAGSIARNELPALKTLRVENNLLRDWDTLNAFQAVFEGVNVTRLYETDIVFERPLGHLAYLDLAVSLMSKKALVLTRMSCRTVFENLPNWDGPGFGLIRNLPPLVKLYPRLKPRVFLHLEGQNKRGQALLDEHCVQLRFQPPTSGTPEAALDLAGFQNTVFACTYARFRHLYERYCVEIGPYTSVRSAPYRLEDPLHCVKRSSVQLCVSGNAFRSPQDIQDTGASSPFPPFMHRPVRDEKKSCVEKSVSFFSSASQHCLHAVPMACPSHFNKKYSITATQWAIHLVCHRWMPHTMLYLEGTDKHGQRFATRYEARSLGKLSRALTTGCAAWVKISDIRLRDMDERDGEGRPLLEVDDEGRVSDYYHSSWQVTPEQGEKLQSQALADQARAMLGKIKFQMLTPGFFSGKEKQYVNCLAYCKRLLCAVGIEDIPTHFWPQSAVKQRMRKEGGEEETPASSV